MLIFIIGIGAAGVLLRKPTVQPLHQTNRLQRSPARHAVHCHAALLVSPFHFFPFCALGTAHLALRRGPFPQGFLSQITLLLRLCKLSLALCVGHIVRLSVAFFMTKEHQVSDRCVANQ